MRILFIPVSIAGGLAVGTIGEQLFEAIWGLIDTRRRRSPGTARSHSASSRWRLTGSWPGEEDPDPE